MGRTQTTTTLAVVISALLVAARIGLAVVDDDKSKPVGDAVDDNDERRRRGRGPRPHGSGSHDPARRRT